MTDPLAYFLTWHTYGTWLQGDEHGSVDRNHRDYERAFVRPNAPLKRSHQDRLDSEPLTLNEAMRIAVQDAVIGVCSYRQWRLHACHVRTTHVHVIVTAATTPERVLNDLKSYATRALRDRNLTDRKIRVWSRHGSTRYLWKDDAVGAAFDYVVEQQEAGLTPQTWVAQ